MSIPNILSLGFLVPRVAHEFDPSGAIRGLRGMPRSLTLVGHYNEDDGQITPGERTQITTEANALAFLGRSQLFEMWKAAKANATLGMPLHVIALAEDAGGTKATSTVVFSGTATQSGTISLWIGGNRVAVPVGLGDTGAVVATNATARVLAANLTVTASASSGTLTLTYKHKGESGNHVDVRVNYYDDERIPAGINATVAAMSGGATNPDCSAVVTAIDGDRATEIVTAFTDAANLALLETELETRWGPMSMMDVQLCYSLRGTEGEITTALNSRNSHQAHCITTRKDLTSPWVTAAMAGAAIESQSWIDPAVPYTTIKLVGYLPAKKLDDWTLDQQNILLTAGGSPLNQDELFRMVTNYTKNSLDADDASYRNLNWVKTLSYYRWFIVTEFQLKYRGYKLAEYIDEPIPGQKVMTKELGEEIMLNLYDQFVDVAIMQNPEYYKKTLLVEVDGTNGKLKVIDEPVLVTQHYQTEITSQYVAGTV